MPLQCPVHANAIPDQRWSTYKRVLTVAISSDIIFVNGLSTVEPTIIVLYVNDCTVCE